MTRSAREIGKGSQAAGNFGETIARNALEFAGIKMIEKVNTPFKILWKKVPRFGHLVNVPDRVFPVEKVSGDFIGIGPQGKKVLAEAKYREDVLSLSDFEDHQRLALETNHQFGGISLVVWVRRREWAIYYWPDMKLEKGKPYQPGDKRGLQLSKPF